MVTWVTTDVTMKVGLTLWLNLFKIQAVDVGRRVFG